MRYYANGWSGAGLSLADGFLFHFCAAHDPAWGRS